jgi:hypothetical protein
MRERTVDCIIAIIAIGASKLLSAPLPDAQNPQGSPENRP